MFIYKVLATIQSNDSIKVQFDKPLHFVGLCREHTWWGISDRSMTDSKTAQCFKVPSPCVIASWERHKGLSPSFNILLPPRPSVPQESLQSEDGRWEPWLEFQARILWFSPHSFYWEMWIASLPLLRTCVLLGQWLAMGTRPRNPNCKMVMGSGFTPRYKAVVEQGC